MKYSSIPKQACLELFILKQIIFEVTVLSIFMILFAQN